MTDDQRFVEEFDPILSRHYDLLFATSKDQMLDVFIENQLLIDIVLVDSLVFNRSGVSFIKTLKEISYIPEFILLRDSSSIKAVTSAMKAGAYDVVDKPINKDDLLTRIDHTLQQSDFVKKVGIALGEQYVEEIQKDLQMILWRELMMQKRLEGDVLSLDECFDFLSIPSNVEKISAEQLQVELEAATQSKFQSEARPTILVVEDEPDWREVINYHLSSHYDLYFAPDGQEALKLATDIKDIDIIFLDMRLPDIHGSDLLVAFIFLS